MKINNLVRGFIRLAIILYVVVWISLGIWNFSMANKNLWLLHGHFSPYLCFSGETSMFWGGSRWWCSLIAQDGFLSKSETDRMLIAEHFFDSEIKDLVAGYGYDEKKFKEWFIKYASSNIESMPVREYIADEKLTQVKYRKIDLSKMPHRRLSYFFFQPELFQFAFFGLLIIYIPMLIIFFAIRWVYLGFKKKS